VVIIPILEVALVPWVKIANTKCLPVQDLPDALTKWNSEARLNRDAFENLNRVPRRGIIIV
jgi:hypothetical protein